VLEYWLEYNVDGFHIEAVQFLFEAAHLRDNPSKGSLEVTIKMEKIAREKGQNIIGLAIVCLLCINFGIYDEEGVLGIKIKPSRTFLKVKVCFLLNVT